MGIIESIIFAHLAESEANQRIKDGDCRWLYFKVGEEVVLPKDCIGIVDKGVLEVYKLHESGKRVIINQLMPGHVFGLVDLFMGEDHNHVHWHTKSSIAILCISGSVLTEWLQRDPILLKAYMVYMNGRIRFLNDRIECFTFGCIKERVAYALNHPKMCTMKKSDLADYLGISRASLYQIGRAHV